MKKNICKMDEDDTSITYKAVCKCGCSQNDTFIMFEIDEYNEPIATFYYPCWPTYWHTSLWERVKKAIAIIFNRRVTVEGDFIFDEESLNDYIEALQSGLEKVKNASKEN